MSVVWSPTNELYSCGDDCTIWKWNLNGEPISKICELESVPIDIKWFPTVKKGDQGKDLFVAGCSDGCFRLVSAVTGRIEKCVEAHKGALVCLAWNGEGSALITGGEDGHVKVWSQAGMLRSTLAQLSQCIHAICWSSEGDQILFASGKDLHIKPLQSSSRQLSWSAHSSAVLAVDWSPVTNLIVSGGEDGKYKVWDNYGRGVYVCPTPNTHAITSVSFCPDGQSFAVGSFNQIRVCDRTGWSHCRETCQTGTFFKIAWTPDSTQLAAAGGNGSVIFAQTVDRKLAYGQFEVSLREANRVRVHDVVADSAEELEHRDKVIKMSMGFGHLIVATSTQCVVYDIQNFNTPHQFDVKDIVNLILQAEKIFAIVDSYSGIQIYNYEGRALSTVRVQQWRPSSLNAQSISLSSDCVAIKDYADPKGVKIFDATNGRQRSDITIMHHMEIAEISLSMYGDVKYRKLAIVDRNRDLYITTVASKFQSHKLATMVSSIMWNDQAEVLVALADGKLITWYYPSVVFVDRDLLHKTRQARDDGQGQVEFGRADQIVDFFGTRCSIRRGADGAVLTFTCSPFPNLLFGHIKNNDWEAATRLCRVVKEDLMWSILAGLAVRGGELVTAEIAYAAIEEYDKLQYMRYIQDMPVPEARAAHLELFQRRVEEAETILLQAGLTYQAIQMNIRLFNWERALELAVQYKTHVDTVLAFRQNYLSTFNKSETNAKFRQMAQGIEINWEKINAKIEEEKKKERARADARPYKP